MSIFRDAALDYAARGWPVIPIRPRNKTPLTPHGLRDASAGEAQVREWWAHWPDANIAVVTGPQAGTFDVLDIDGDEGYRVLEALEVEHGRLPAGPRQRTGGGGLHILFRSGTLGTTTRRLPGIDTRGAGGYIVVAPSIHPSGGTYAWEDEDEPLPDPLAWLLDVLGSGPGSAARPALPLGATVTIDDETARVMLSMARIPLCEIPSGGRNDAIFRIAARLRGGGDELPAILVVVGAANRLLCRPPLDDNEVARICTSAARYAVSETAQRSNDAIRAAQERLRNVDEQISSVEDRRRRDQERVQAQADQRRERLELQMERARARREQAEAQAGEAASVVALTEEATAAIGAHNVEAIRGMLARELGHPVVRVIQRGSDHASYWLDVGDGGEPVYLGTSLLMRAPLADAVMRSRLKAVGIANLSDKRWPAVRAALVALVVQQRDSDETERIGQTFQVLRDIYQTESARGSLARDYTAVLRHRAFVDGEFLYVNCKSLASRITETTGKKIGIHDVSARLQEIGAERPGRTGMVSESAGPGNRTQARYWRVPLSRVLSDDHESCAPSCPAEQTANEESIVEDVEADEEEGD